MSLPYVQPVTAMNPSIMQVCGCPTPISERPNAPWSPICETPSSRMATCPIRYPMGMNGQMCPWKSQTPCGISTFFEFAISDPHCRFYK